MRRLVFQCVFAFLCLFSSAAKTFGQTGPEVIDVRPYAPLHGSSMESVSLTNGSLNLDIPVWSVPQRGALKLDFTLRYDSVTYYQTYDCFAGPGGGGNSGTSAVQTVSKTKVTSSTSSGASANFRPPAGSCTPPNCDTNNSDEFCQVSWDISGLDTLAIFPFGAQEGVRFMSSTDIAVTLSAQTSNNGPNGNVALKGYYWVVNTPDGGAHKMAQTVAGDFRVVDGTGWEYDPTHCLLKDIQGTKYQFDCTPSFDPYTPAGPLPRLLQWEEDSNGNRITLNYHTDSNNAVIFDGWTDTEGRNVPPLVNQASGSANPSCPAGTSGSKTWLPPGVSNPIIFCYTNVILATDLFVGNPQASILPQDYIEFSGGINAISAMITPSNDLWTFSYLPLQGDQYYGTSLNFGELRQIGLPTGGFIRYHWAHTVDLCGVFPQGSMARSYVLEKDVLESASATPAVWGYGAAPQGASGTNSSSSGVSDPYGNTEIDTLTAIGKCSFYATKIVHQDSQQHTLLTETKDYQALNSNLLGSFNFDGSGIPTGVVPVQEYQTWPDGTQKETVLSYAPSVMFNDDNGNPVPVSNGLVSSELEYDYGAGSPGALLADKETTYWASGNTSAFAQNMISKPSNVTITDSVTGKFQSTDYTYDEYSLASGNASASGWNASPSNGTVRGNQTGVSRYLDTNGLGLKTVVHYNDTGTIASVTLPSNSPLPDTTTTYSYSAAYDGAALTSVTNALGLSKSYTYYPITTLLNTATDENSQLTTYTYWPDMRLHQILYPATAAGQAETEYRYPSSVEVDKRQRKDASTWIAQKTLYNGLGDVSETQLLNACNGGDYIAVDTTYDLIERTASVSNPHCGASTSQTDGVTLHGSMAGGHFVPGYDGLGRPTLVTDPDGISTQSWQYSGNSI